MNKLFTPKWVMFFVIVLIVIGCIFEATAETTIIFAGLVVGWFLAVALHELGHVIFGLFGRFAFMFFAIGPFQMERTSTGIKLTENKNWMFFGGVSSMLPPENIDRNVLRKRWSLFVAGGPIMSLLFTVCFTICYWLIQQKIIALFAIINAVIFFSTIIPANKGMQTDGYTLLTLLKNNEESAKYLEGLLVKTELSGPKAPAQWKEEYVQYARQQNPSVENIIFAYMIYYYEIDQNNFQSAIQAMESYRKIPITKKNKFQLGFLIHMEQLSCFLCENEVQLDRISVLQKLLSPMDAVNDSRVKAIIAYLQGDINSAKKHLYKVKNVIQQMESLYGFYKAERKLTELVEAKMFTNAAFSNSHRFGM